ncbi:MAG: peptidyl-prolyl cis-trans isomerase [Deltaproteobacteria bacterium]|nr:peptidyl-prolyl cis-trans isomerase [Deltaproteobacteria bacterium]
MRRLVLSLSLAALAAACSPKSGSEKKGPFVAEGNGVAVSAEEFKARLDEQSPFIRSRYTTLERKKEFLDNLVRFEVLAKEAERQGLDKDPDVQNTLRKVMVQKLVQRSFGDQEAAGKLPEAETREYYEKHRDEYVKPLRLRVYQILVKAPASGAERAKKQDAARKILAQLRAEEKKNQLAFVSVAREKSEDDATKALGGDLNFRSRDDLEKLLGKAAADAAFGLRDGETSGVVESPQGFLVLKVAGRQEAVDRPFEQVKVQISQKLYRERKTKEFDEFVKRLRETAAVKVNDAELEKVAVQGPPAPGMPAGGPLHGAQPPGMPPPAAPVAK